MISENDIMADYDAEKYLDSFCKISNCTKCNGRDMNGEPNGYGCNGQEEYAALWYTRILKMRLKKISKRRLK